MDIKYILPSLLLVTSSSVFANYSTGNVFINSPPGRASLCSGSGGGLNQGCSQVQYKPQSVEGVRGFPEKGGVDGKGASGGNATFNALNEQSLTRLHKTPGSAINSDDDDDVADRDFINHTKLFKYKSDNIDYVSYDLEVKSSFPPSSVPEYTWLLPENAEQIDNSDNHSHFVIKKTDDAQLSQVKVGVTAGKKSKVLIEKIDAPGLNHEYDYVFPEHLFSYKAGTIIYQPVDKKRYECRPFPYSGYCVQWSPYASQYEPGVGFYWTWAWTLLD